MNELQEAEDAHDAADDSRQRAITEAVIAFRDYGARGLHLVTALNNLCAAYDDYERTSDYWIELNDIEQQATRIIDEFCAKIDDDLDKRSTEISDENYLKLMDEIE